MLPLTVGSDNWLVQQIDLNFLWKMSPVDAVLEGEITTLKVPKMSPFRIGNMINYILFLDLS